jgi:hypothetical protein
MPLGVDLPHLRQRPPAALCPLRHSTEAGPQRLAHSVHPSLRGAFDTPWERMGTRRQADLAVFPGNVRPLLRFLSDVRNQGLLWLSRA